MLVKFFSRGSGDGESPTNYLLGDLRDREGATVLRGNPEITKEIINATDYTRRYTSGCLSFEEAADDITDRTKAWIMDEFEKTLFAGLESDQYNILWVEHKDKNQTDKNGKPILGADGQPIKRQELNFLIPNQELRSGKRLQPFFHWADMMRVNAFQNVVNMKFKFSDPHDPSKRRTSHPYFSRSANLKGFEEKEDKKLSAKGIGAKANRAKLTERQETESFLTEYMYDLAARARLANRAAIEKELKNQGYEIERVAKRYISISAKKLKKNIRLDDPIFSEDYDQRNYIAVALQQKQEQYERDKHGKIFRESLDILNEGVKRKTEYHQKRFASADVPKPFDISLDASASAQAHIDEPAPARPKDDSSPSLDY